MRRSRSVAATFVSLALAALLAGPAALEAAPALSFLAKGGVSSCDLRGHQYIDTHRIVTGVGGAGFGMAFTPKLSLETDVLWIRKGASLGESEATDPSGNPLGKFSTLVVSDWIEVPVLGRYQVPGKNALQPYAMLGPTFAFLSKDELQFTGYLNQTLDESVFKSFDMVITVGGGFEYGQGSNRLLFDLRYDLGLTKHNEWTTEVQTDAAMVMVGYAYHPGH